MTVVPVNNYIATNFKQIINQLHATGLTVWWTFIYGDDAFCPFNASPSLGEAVDCSTFVG